MSAEGAAVSLGAAVVSAVFGALVFNQWRARKKPYQIAWSVGLVLYAVAAFMQFLAEAYGWTVTVYKVYYLVAALLVAVLGIGSLLLVNRRAGLGFVLYTLVVFAGFVLAIAGASVNTVALQSAIPVAGNALPDPNVRLFSFLFTIPGSIALIGIAAVSYWRSRLAFNLWIGIGALIIAAGGSLARLNVTWALYIGEFAGIAVMFWGFLVSQDLAKAKTPTAEHVPT